MNGVSVSDISINMTATTERNQSRIECYDVTMDSPAYSVAKLTVRGEELHTTFTCGLKQVVFQEDQQSQRWSMRF